MVTFHEWLGAVREGSDRNGRELIELLRDADWSDLSGEVAVFDGWQAGSKENKVYVSHPTVGRFMVTVSARSRIPPRQLLNTVMKDYRIKADQLRGLQASRRAV